MLLALREMLCAVAEPRFQVRRGKIKRQYWR